jgi:hypothetical protein
VAQIHSGCGKKLMAVRFLFREIKMERCPGWFCRKATAYLALAGRFPRKGWPTGEARSLSAFGENGDPMKPSLLIASIALFDFAVTGCDSANDSLIPLTSNATPPILLFNGTGTSPNDVAAVERILNEQHLQYSTTNSVELNNMSESRLRSYRLLIIPGGNYIAMGNGVMPSTTAKIRDAVQNW